MPSNQGICDRDYASAIPEPAGRVEVSTSRRHRQGQRANENDKDAAKNVTSPSSLLRRSPVILNDPRRRRHGSPRPGERHMRSKSTWSSWRPAGKVVPRRRRPATHPRSRPRPAGRRQQRLCVGLVQLEDAIVGNDKMGAGQNVDMRDAFRRLQPRPLQRRPKPVGRPRPKVDHSRRRRSLHPRPGQRLRGRSRPGRRGGRRGRS